jgi:hypothetical protein
MSSAHLLMLIKLAHTAIWTIMATAILALPVAAVRRRFRLAGWITALIVLECVVLALNRGRCPLTDLAAHYAAADHASNFDIYLPEWLAEHNKTIFGSLFIVGELVWLWQWLVHSGATASDPSHQ